MHLEFWLWDILENDHLETKGTQSNVQLGIRAERL